MMICPKCGLEQEERLDCKECGIVFSKYNALFQSSQSQDSTGEEASTNSEFQELQIKVRELSAKSIDIEFEKAERKKLRTDVKDLEEQVRRNQQEIENRIRQMEDRLQTSGVENDSKISPEILEILEKSEEMEEKTAKITDNLNRTINQLTSLWEKTGQNSFQITELNNQLAALRNEMLGLKTQVEALQKNHSSTEPKTIAEDDVKAIRQNLDELGQFISSLGKSQ
ncbi:MAG: hypothetical protein JXR49_07160 [Acidobacteria bacterium]|nr:hypothetical protein [Acidobacteriota bacterium]